jgi:tetratricopeptide (TPR) repeat protein
LGNSAHAFADITELNWQNANRFYQQKQYDSAVVYYEKIAVLQSSNSALYYNLGNAYYRLNKIGNAVLNYERALFYDPSNHAAKDNLLLTQNRISNKMQVAREIFFVRWWQYITQGNHARFWAILSLFLFGGLLALLVLKRLGKLPEHVPVQVYFIGALILVMTLFCAFNAADNYSNTNFGVVMFNNTPFNSAAAQQNKAPLMLLQEGTVVSIELQQNSLLNITLPDGRNGWIQQTAITYVQPQRK